jgi:hypothetical protein
MNPIHKRVFIGIAALSFVAYILICIVALTKQQSDIKFLTETVKDVHQINKALVVENQYLTDELVDVVRQREELKEQLEFSRSLQFKYKQKPVPIKLAL